MDYEDPESIAHSNTHKHVVRFSASVFLFLATTSAVEIVFRMLEPPNNGDERSPGNMTIPIQVAISPIDAVLQEDISVTVTAVGGTAAGKQMWHISGKMTSNLICECLLLNGAFYGLKKWLGRSSIDSAIYLITCYSPALLFISTNYVITQMHPDMTVHIFSSLQRVRTMRTFPDHHLVCCKLSFPWGLEMVLWSMLLSLSSMMMMLRAQRQLC